MGIQKFRALDKRKNQVSFPFLLNDKGVFFRDDNRPVLMEEVLYTKEKYELQQNTGVHDRLGNEIYSGDWLEVEGKIFVVYYSSDFGAYMGLERNGSREVNMVFFSQNGRVLDKYVGMECSINGKQKFDTE